jgi:hypothetical protein
LFHFVEYLRVRGFAIPYQLENRQVSRVEHY